MARPRRVQVRAAVRNDASLVDALFRARVAQYPAGTPVCFDVTGANRVAVQLAERYGMQPVFQTARIYRTITRPKIHLPLDRWFGVTSFELD